MNMMPSLPPDDPLERATAALRQTSVPTGPSEETRARTLAALQAGSAAPAPVPFFKRKGVTHMVKIAAALLVLSGGAFLASGLVHLGSPLAFAEVAEKLRQAHTLAYKLTVQGPEMKKPMSMQVYAKEPGMIRMEAESGPVSIGRMPPGKTLTLDPHTKTALLVEVKKTPARRPGQVDAVQFAEQLRQLVNKEGRPAGKQKIGNVETIGFRVQDGGQEWLVWADPKTKLPVRVEAKWPAGIEAALTDFRLDLPLEDALFSLQPPAGYKLQKMELDSLDPEDAVLWVLRHYAETSGGKFPAKLNDPAALGKYFGLQLGKQPGQKTEKQKVEPVINVTEVFVFLSMLKGNYGYKPEGVKLGDADKILFWYRPAGAAKWRAIYGDLHVADVDPQQLPEKPKK